MVEEAQTNQKTKEMSGDHSSGVKTSSKKTSKSRVSGEVEVQDGEVEIRIDVDTGGKKLFFLVSTVKFLLYGALSIVDN